MGWTHQSYQASPLMEAILMLMFSMADQGGIEGWALTHALHHTNSDTPEDPHNRAAGFWYCHFGWIFSTKKYKITHRDYVKVKSGLGRIVRFHDRVYLLWDPFWSLVFPALVASLWGEAWDGFLVAGAARWCFV